MAKAVRIPPEVQPTSDMRDVQLTLTEYEARVLKFVCARIGGAPGSATPRGAMDSISDALWDAGVSAGDFFSKPESRAIHFK